jgi:membrane-associated protease RseP (regulator of RpoE activity)
VGFWTAVVVFVVGVLLSIALHEVGHLVPAKRFGVRCSQYMVGFGNTLWSFTRGDTEYGIKSIPLGGYVRMLGMFPPRSALSGGVDSNDADSNRAGANRAGANRAGASHAGVNQSGGRLSLVEQAREDAQRDIGPEDADRLFYQRSVPKRVLIMAGGPTMNLLICTVLVVIAMCGTGLPRTGTSIGTLSQCLPTATTATGQQCGANTPARVAGLQVGDKIVAWNGQRLSDWTAISQAMRTSGGQASEVVVERAGRELTLKITPALVDRTKIDASGNAVMGADGKPAIVKAGAIGVSPATEYQGTSISEVPRVLWLQFAGTAGLIWQIPVKLYGVVMSLGSSTQRDPSGPISLIGVGRIAGQIGEETTSTGGGGWRGWWSNELMLLASLNMALFVFNLIPLLPLDGGHVAGALWEAVRRRVARRFGRPDPGPVDMIRSLPVTYGVASLLVAMSLLLMYADVVKPVKLGG